MSNKTDRTAVRARIHGRVQGVAYRVWTEREANRLGLHGWVRNREDGSVEALFVGATDKVDEMLGLCRHGPSRARVDDIEQEDAKGITAKRFEIKPTV
jgi:acylphosphatase